jgi:hypothetical protein
MTTLSTVLAGLGRDVTIGGLTSPLLSWLAAGALLVFFGWQVVRLLTGVARASAPFAELHPLLTSLAEDVEASDLSRSYERAWSIGRTSARDAKTAVDFDRLTRLDTSMRESDALRRPWIQLRKTLLIEHVSWFKEPRIFSTRRAEEFFTLGGRPGTGGRREGSNCEAPPEPGREAYCLYVERPDSGGNEADGPLSTAAGVSRRRLPPRVRTPGCRCDRSAPPVPRWAGARRSSGRR